MTSNQAYNGSALSMFRMMNLMDDVSQKNPDFHSKDSPFFGRMYLFVPRRNLGSPAPPAAQISPGAGSRLTCRNGGIPTGRGVGLPRPGGRYSSAAALMQ